MDLRRADPDGRRFFIVLMTVPFFTIMDTIGTPMPTSAAAGRRARRGH